VVLCDEDNSFYTLPLFVRGYRPLFMAFVAVAYQYYLNNVNRAAMRQARTDPGAKLLRMLR
jgi:hypothetical protein